MNINSSVRRTAFGQVQPLAVAIVLATQCWAQVAWGQSALAAWMQVAKPIRDCMMLAAQRSNTSLEAIIAAGVLPTDQRLDESFKLCHQFVDGLKTDYLCDLKTPAGPKVSTRCNQFWAVRQGSGYQKVTKEEAFAAAFTSQASRFFIVEEESAQGLAERSERIRQTLQSATPSSDQPSKDAPTLKESSNIKPKTDLSAECSNPVVLKGVSDLLQEQRWNPYLRMNLLVQGQGLKAQGVTPAEMNKGPTLFTEMEQLSYDAAAKTSRCALRMGNDILFVYILYSVRAGQSGTNDMWVDGIVREKP